MRRRAFTVIELMVVIGIIVLLAGILLGVMANAKRAAINAKAQSDLATIATALSAYKQEFGDYPRIDTAALAPGGDPLMNDLGNSAYLYGSELLCWALVGPYNQSASGPFSPGDGSNGPGWRERGQQGQVVGSFINTDTIHFGTNKTAPRYQTLLDGNGWPILYMPSRVRKSEVDSAGKTVAIANSNEFGYLRRSATALYDFRYIDPAYSQNGNDAAARLARAQVLFGDTNANGYIDGSESRIDADFILISAGADEIYGTEDDARNPQ